MAASRSLCGCFETRVLHFKVRNTFWTLWTRKLRFWWGISVCIFKCLPDVLYIFLFCAKEKSQNAPQFEMDFVLNFAMCHFFKRAGEREVELRHVHSRILIGQFYFLLVPNMVLSKRIITSIGQSKHMRVTRFKSL